MYLREVTGPPGAPVVVLLHGWTATADLNFFTTYATLGEHFRVLAFDHRGHGRGIRSRRTFRLEDCADDVAAMIDTVGAGPVVALGYSMGGTVAQLLWRRHPHHVRGLVLAATASHFNAARNERLSFLGLTGLAVLARLTPSQARRWLTHQLYLQRKTSSWSPWAVEQVVGHDWRMVVEAGKAIGSFRSDDWLAEVDVPTAVVVTMQDPVVPVRRQMQLFEAIPTAQALRIDAGHDAIVARPDRAVPMHRQGVRAGDRMSARRWTGAVLALAAVVALATVWRRSSGDGPIRRTSRTGRNLELARLGVSVGTTYAGTGARKLFASAERRVELDDAARLRTAEQVAQRLGNMKGALMKVGQMASYLDDGLPDPVRQALASLQADAPPMSADLAAEVVERELGRPPTDVFVEWDPEPIAAASIGQVHRAVAIDPDTGDEVAVAVKVQYPGVADAIEADLANTDLLGTLLRQGFSGLDPTELVAEVKQRITEELDYRQEAANQTRFVEFYRDHPFIHVPAVLPHLSTGRVLTSELVIGASWRDALGWEQEQRDLAGEGLFRFVFRSLYRMRAFNGDPHPGNYLFHGDGRISFIDFGLVRYFSRAELQVFESMVRAAAVDHDAAAFRRIIEEAGLLRPGRTGADRRGGRVLLAVLRGGPRGPDDDVDAGVLQRHRPSHVRPVEPDRPVRHGAAGVRDHPAHQPRAVRAARRPAGDRQLSPDGRGAVAVRRRSTVDAAWARSRRRGWPDGQPAGSGR